MVSVSEYTFSEMLQQYQQHNRTVYGGGEVTATESREGTPPEVEAPAETDAAEVAGAARTLEAIRESMQNKMELMNSLQLLIAQRIQSFLGRMENETYARISGKEVATSEPAQTDSLNDLLASATTGSGEAPEAGYGSSEFQNGTRIMHDYESAYYERESVSFSSQGTVRTADGAEFSFNVDLQMERESAEYVRQTMLIDPLVINYSGTAAQLESTYFSFDLDADGALDEIPMLADGSGYLALDKNGDGVINDGSELFGVASGDGFADLAAYDEDGNGWIDENDSIYDSLQIWDKDADGNDVLSSLSDYGIGAIGLDSVDTTFRLVEDGETLGAIMQTGIALTESYQAVTVQQLDLSMRPSAAVA